MNVFTRFQTPADTIFRCKNRGRKKDVRTFLTLSRREKRVKSVLRVEKRFEIFTFFLRFSDRKKTAQKKNQSRREKKPKRRLRSKRREGRRGAEGEGPDRRFSFEARRSSSRRLDLLANERPATPRTGDFPDFGRRRSRVRFPGPPPFFGFWGGAKSVKKNVRILRLSNRKA